MYAILAGVYAFAVFSVYSLHYLLFNFASAIKQNKNKTTTTKKTNKKKVILSVLLLWMVQCAERISCNAWKWNIFYSITIISHFMQTCVCFSRVRSKQTHSICVGSSPFSSCLLWLSVPLSPPPLLCICVFFVCIYNILIQTRQMAFVPHTIILM